MKINEKLQKLRELMKEYSIDAYIIPSFDAHQSEYVAEHWKCRQWISGFTGSAGTVVVTLSEAGLWTDGRYHIQAEKQLKGTGIKLFKEGLPDVPSYVDWLNEILFNNSVIGFDGRVFSTAAVKKMQKKFMNKNIKIQSDYDLIGAIWNDRPDIPDNPIMDHDVKYAGKSRIEKLAMVRENMTKNKAQYYVLSSLDDIAWLFNIRGNDVNNNPVVTSYALIEKENAFLFVDTNKVNNITKGKLEEDGVIIKHYNEIKEYIEKIEQNETIIFDPSKTNFWLYSSIKPNVKKVEELNITTKLKSIKNSVEIENLKNCEIRDCIAVVKFMKWLEENIEREEITEITVEEKLKYFRSQQKLFMNTSFDTIAGYKEHAAMMHYKATEENTYKLKKEGFLLFDSGGQYLDGTTDITRTISLGNISEEEKKDFTLVLKGMIDLSMIKFLYGTTGSNLDIIARMPIWQQGIDYKCGTGHGVGFFLNVHEGPHRISLAPNDIKLEEGMVVTNEPGIYKENRHGIRLENMLLVVNDEKTEFGQFMKFETLTYCPIDIEAIDVTMLTDEERNWLNNYHKQVYDKLSIYLNEDEKQWLKNKTRKI
ncbi:putative peptidase [Clostridium tepidiprofundi DSM 19306]|uniref:Putative peptidase n=1 Tax=Clostridium tepidiprofundi DSM 19306 TaxID=1121338 RepID=A0A151B830_9CLOT|nr:aminopeptidase P family protein [Clostridium tepidiprofundi]KYH35973.1 putative peptidase [Clostridium tepidiprofundi DSM 19306]